MNMFTILNDILYKKSGKMFAKREAEAEFQPYMIQRWISMYSDINVRILNATTNKIYKGLDTKEQWYKLFLNTIPKNKFKKISYIKKTSGKSSGGVKTSEDKAIKFIAESKEMSEREVREYIKEYNIDISDLVKSLKSSEE